MKLCHNLLPIFLILISGLTYSCSGEEKEVKEAVAEVEEEEEELEQETQEKEVVETAPEPVAPPAKVKEAPARSYAGYNVGNHLYVKASGLNVRSGPGPKMKVVTKLGYGTKITIWAKKGNWLKIGESEWVFKKGLTPQFQYSNKAH